MLATTRRRHAAGAVTFVPALKKLSNANVLMLTVGILTLVEGIALILWGSQPYSVPAFSGEQPFAVGGILIPTQALLIVLTAAIIIAGPLVYDRTHDAGARHSVPAPKIPLQRH